MSKAKSKDLAKYVIKSLICVVNIKLSVKISFILINNW
jgi:hypothetical protein